jgi:hypothetical protein
VQLEVDGDALFGADLGQFGFQFGDSATEPSYLKAERLLRSAAYVTQQSACHFATFHVPEPAQAGVLSVR